MAQFAGKSDCYIFEGAGGMRDQLEQTILSELDNKQYPLKATIANVKSGKGLAGAMFETKEQCVVIELGDNTRVCISNTTVGSYLYVGVYLMLPLIGNANTSYAAQIGDVFKLQKYNAYYAAALAATESAFAKLGLKQSNSGYTPTSMK